jgi:inner membrane protein
MSNFTNWIKTSHTIKFAAVGILVLLLLIPTSMIEGLIGERQSQSHRVISEISSKWGFDQTIAGPIINIPYKELVASQNDKGQTVYTNTISTMHFLPNQLDITGNVKTAIKHRSIYDAVVYTTELHFKGNFDKIAIEKLGITPENVLWNKAYVSIHIPDLRGINKRVVMNWNKDTLEMNPGIDNNDILITSLNKFNSPDYARNAEIPATVPYQNNAVNGSSGLSTKVDVKESGKINFEMTLDLNGSSSLYFIPIGKETNVSLKSTYKTPSFDGAFITDTNVINNNGFDAKWKVLNLNRNFPQEWTNSSYNIGESAFGVNLLIPVDHYQKSMRSAKYAIMFIMLTFLVFLFTELLNGFKIHPVQYLLVGLALIIFYTLLLSISEQLGFTIAYLISSVAVIILISLYSRTIFKENRLMALLAGILIILYGFLFVILRSEDYALLIGSIGLFIVLCVIMYLSRKIKWYNEESDNQLG